MTTTFALKSCAVFLALIIFPSVVLAARSSTGRPKIQEEKPCKRFVLYYHNILFNGTDTANATAVAATNATNLGTTNMGMLVTFNDPITTDGNLLSPPVALAQGFYIYDRKDAYNAWLAFTLVFNSTEHKGTLSILGADIFTASTRDLSVVGGTGDFFMARGIATIAEANIGSIYYARLKFDIKLYECY